MQLEASEDLNGRFPGFQTSAHLQDSSVRRDARPVCIAVVVVFDLLEPRIEHLPRHRERLVRFFESPEPPQRVAAGEQQLALEFLHSTKTVAERQGAVRFVQSVLRLASPYEGYGENGSRKNHMIQPWRSSR